uniref:Uncharacterized protein n=1 Tax=Arundo donax TaxID=35708 RepID=A0A0A9HNL5_ARUDO
MQSSYCIILSTEFRVLSWSLHMILNIIPQNNGGAKNLSISYC